MHRCHPALLLVSLALLAGAAQAQAIWKWRDENGVLQVSDQPPPNSVPLKDIVSRPNGQTPRGLPITPATPDTAAPEAASAPARMDNELEARKKKMQADKAAAADERKQADKARMDALKADNCKRAKAQLALLDSGVRMARANDKGEREFLDDKARAEETNRARSAVNENCQ
jgi:hypothetical protein